MLIAGLLKVFASGQTQGGIPRLRLDVWQGILLGEQQGLTIGGLQMNLPTGSVCSHDHSVISRLACRHCVGDHAVREWQVHHRDAHPRADSPADQRVAAIAIVGVSPHVIGASLQGIAHSHGQHADMGIGAVCRVGKPGPIHPAGPLVSTGPGGVGAWPGPVGTEGCIVGAEAGWQQIAPHDQTRLSLGYIHQPDIPTEGVGRNIHLEEPPGAGGLVCDGTCSTVECGGLWHEQLANQFEGIQRLRRIVDANIPDIRLMTGPL